MSAADPTYPLYPSACLLASTGVFLVLFTSFIRQSWNLGVTFLCFWLLIENLAGAIDSIIWSDNATIKWEVYCDIVSRLGLITHVVKPLSTLTIMRRLYLIASQVSEGLSGSTSERWNLWVEWILGLVLPILVGGPIYYVNQGARFEIVEGFGCTNTSVGSILFVLLIESWTIVPPLLSIVIYYPRVIRTFYCQRRATRQFVYTGDSIESTDYLRILVLASLDILLTLPIGVINAVLFLISELKENRGHIPFYPGWTTVHSNWKPVSIPYVDLTASGPFTVGQLYFTYWTSPTLAFTIFGLFGFTRQARALYSHAFFSVAGWFGWKQDARIRSSSAGLATLRFAAQSQDTDSMDLEMGTAVMRTVIPLHVAHEDKSEDVKTVST